MVTSLTAHHSYLKVYRRATLVLLWEASVSVKYGLLGILARKPQHGYELKRTFEQLTGGFWELNYGQIYQSLDRLSEEGYVNFTVEQEDNVPDKKVYAITEEGKRALKEWLATPEEPRPRPLRDELFIRLAVMSSKDITPMLELISQHQQVYLEKMQELTQSKRELAKARRGRSASSDDLIEELLVEVALLHAEADVKWLELCESRLRSLARAKAN
jgi:DNA-binding PadR family transcriptional regulator